MIRFTIGTLVLGIAVGTAPAQGKDDKVNKTFSDSYVEGLLREVDARYKKGRDLYGNPYWDFSMHKYKCRLTNYGRDLMMDAVFGAIPAERANEWNRTAKFSRVVAYTPKTGNPYSAVETNLDCVAGITDAMFRQWLKRFGLEVKRYAKFTLKTVVSDQLYKRVTQQLIESALTKQNIRFQLTSKQNNNLQYTYTNKDKYRIVLTVFNNGTDLMLSANFPATTLQKINGYNLKRKFIRAVLYTNATALESNLDCIAGVSTSMLSYYLRTYDLDLRDFALKLFNGRQN